MNVPPNDLHASNNVKKKYPQVFYEITLSLIIIFPTLTDYYACVSLLYLHGFNISIAIWRDIIIFEFYCLGFIFTCSTIFTASIIFCTFKPTTTPTSSTAVFKHYLFIFLWVSLAMIGYNIQFLVLIISTTSIVFPSFIIPVIAVKFAIMSFLVMNAYVIAFWILASGRFFWVFGSAYGFSDTKESLEFFEGTYPMTFVVMTGFLAICCAIESTDHHVAHKVLVVMFMGGIMVVVAIITNLLKKLVILVWMDVLEN